MGATNDDRPDGSTGRLPGQRGGRLPGRTVADGSRRGDDVELFGSARLGTGPPRRVCPAAEGRQADAVALGGGQRVASTALPGRPKVMGRAVRRSREFGGDADEWWGDGVGEAT